MSDVRDLIGDDVGPDELERLQRVHTLLEQAGPPPSLSPGLARPPAPGGEVIRFPRRYRPLAAVGAAAAAALLFAVGYLVGDSGPGAGSAGGAGTERGRGVTWTVLVTTSLTSPSFTTRMLTCFSPGVAYAWETVAPWIS